jgi:hypothetical protein
MRAARTSRQSRASVSRPSRARGRTQITPFGRSTGGLTGDRVAAPIGVSARTVGAHQGVGDFLLAQHICLWNLGGLR